MWDSRVFAVGGIGTLAAGDQNVSNVPLIVREGGEDTQNSIYVGIILIPPQKGGMGIFSSPSKRSSTSLTCFSKMSLSVRTDDCRLAQAPILEPRILRAHR